MNYYIITNATFYWTTRLVYMIYKIIRNNKEFFFWKKIYEKYEKYHQKVKVKFLLDMEVYK